MEIAALLVTALLFGGTVLYSFGFAGFIFSALPAKQAGTVIRRAFPHFYLFVIAFSAIAAVLLSTIDIVASGVLAAVAVTTIPTRQFLMPAINNATDAGKRKRFQLLHSLSVIVTLVHILAVAIVLARFL